MKQVHFSSTRGKVKSRAGAKPVKKVGLFSARNKHRALLGDFRKRDMTDLTFQSQRRRKSSRASTF